MDHNLNAQSGNKKNYEFGTVDEPTASTSTYLDVGDNYNKSSFEKANIEFVPVEKNTSRLCASCKIRIRDDKSDMVIGLNESVQRENTDKATINTVDDLSTTRPNLSKKFRVESKKKIALSAQGNYPDPPAA